MKEFGAQQGGRYTYADDLLNLQELALAFSSIFSECDNFIISGCEVSGSSISAGYVYINGKLRYFSGASGINSWPQFIYEQNRSESVAYASGSDKVGRYIYGCALAATVPSSLDPLTNAVPEAIRLTSSGGLRMREALFGKYALLRQTSNSSQLVEGEVEFTNDINVTGWVVSEDGMQVQKGTGVAKIEYDGSTMRIRSRIGTGKIYDIKVVNDSGFQFAIDSVVVGEFLAGGFTSALPISVLSGTVGDVNVASDHIYNSEQSSDSAALNINMKGYNGTNNKYRNTYIGNGKGVAILSIVGSTGAMTGNGTLTLVNSAQNALTLKSTMARTNMALRKLILWTDSSDTTIAYIGFNSTTANVFEINNAIADINIIAQEAVNIGPAIKENGSLLSEKYLTRSDFTTAHANKADASSVYTKTEANNLFATKAGGFTQFVDNSTQAALRQQIGALGVSDVSGVFARIDQLLADIATTDARKQTIRNNIGAAGVGDFQPVIPDTGWILIQSGLYARQIGKIVCVQGKLTTRHQSTVFTLPNQVSSPAYDVTFRSNNKNWGGYIAGGSRDFIATCTGDHGDTISFSLTYMVQ